MTTIHIVYKTTNLINQRYYVGKHTTNNLNDEYLGSGKLLCQAVSKYGKENFKREILYIFETEADAFLKEAEIVNVDLISDPMCYNLAPGGCGGNTHNEESLQRLSEKLKGCVPWNKGISMWNEQQRREIGLRNTSKQSDETIAKRVSKTRGQTRTPEQKKRISDGVKRRRANGWKDETLEKMSKAKKGKPWSEARRRAYELKKASKLDT